MLAFRISVRWVESTVVGVDHGVAADRGLLAQVGVDPGRRQAEGRLHRVDGRAASPARRTGP